jgi:quercetin dioxygenase-like cupin family protein
VLGIDSWFARHGPDWRPDPLFLGSTRSLGQLRITAFEATHGVRSHPGHTHPEEQISIGLTESTTLEIGDRRAPFELDLEPGTFAYLPPGTVHGVGDSTRIGSRLVDLSWIGTSRGAQVPLGMCAISTGAASPDEIMLHEHGRSAVELLSGPTATLDRLRVLRVDMRPGFVGPPDTDAYDVVVLVRAGAVRTLGAVVAVGDAVFYAAGEEHTIAVEGDESVELLVVELHSVYAGRPVRSVRRMITRRLPQPVRMMLRRWREAVTGRRRRPT